MGRGGLFLLTAVFVAGCGSPANVGPTPYPLPSGAAVLALPTQPPRPAADASVIIGCVLLPPEPVRMNWDPNAHSVSFSFNPWGDAASNVILWPHGFSAREYRGRAELVAPDGRVVARHGDAIIEVVGAGPGSICQVNGTIY